MIEFVIDKNDLKKIEDKLNGVQNDVSNLVKSFSTVPPEPVAETTNTKEKKPKAPNLISTNSVPLLLQCKQWEDFQRWADQAQTVSYALKDSEKTYEITALRDNQVISYEGELPEISLLIKMYLSRQLGVPESQIVEGEIALG